MCQCLFGLLSDIGLISVVVAYCAAARNLLSKPHHLSSTKSVLDIIPSIDTLHAFTSTLRHLEDTFARSQSLI